MIFIKIADKHIYRTVLLCGTLETFFLIMVYINLTMVFIFFYLKGIKHYISNQQPLILIYDVLMTT
jgi:hypothetical protein